MPAEAFEDTLDLEVELLEAELPSSSAEPSYPYPRLSRTGRTEPRTIRSLVLENATLRAVVLPDLGGRLWSILDKRTGIEILPTNAQPRAAEGGPRGVILPYGIVSESSVGQGLTLLGSTLWAIEPEGEEGSAAIWIGDACDGTGIGRHVRYRLASEEPELRIEQKAFNRTYKGLPYNGALTFHLFGGEATHEGHFLTWFCKERKAGLWIDRDETLLDGAGFDRDLVLARFAETKTLAARQTDTLSIRVLPFSGLRSIDAANGEVAASLTERGIQIQTSRARPGHKLVLLTAAGETLETAVDLYPERLLEFPAETLPGGVTELALLSPAKQEILRIGDPPPSAFGPCAIGCGTGLHAPAPAERRHDDLLRLAFDVTTRHSAYLLLAREVLAHRELDRAEACLEQALLYDGEDHLAWWVKAMCGRLREGPSPDSTEGRPELLNAHFLAPLEPALRAEAFLAQDPEMGKEPSPLLKALEDVPETFVEVAALLTDLGLNDQATRWIDEALRHVDLAMLHYLQAYCYLRASRMHVEAAECIAAARRLGFTPPLPWRDVEWQALSALHARFPSDEVLGRYAGLRRIPSNELDR